MYNCLKATEKSNPLLIPAPEPIPRRGYAIKLGQILNHSETEDAIKLRSPTKTIEEMSAIEGQSTLQTFICLEKATHIIGRTKKCQFWFCDVRNFIIQP
ncbi:hypothetical protein AVEN_148377-1 [Araneus ventricosus]|uniref:Uncharacterized protein n=1 Tax=Araneus ventricosus TaxID=182803 RepID=A0A4Y2K3Y5_ARAVE|nr:hypothetical protein AVEN_148377-1 [Araneus ventricosus]